MTREIKLALIVGFALVLTVGILIADHFSQANAAGLASIDREQPHQRDAAPIQRILRNGAEAINDAFVNPSPPLAKTTQADDPLINPEPGPDRFEPAPVQQITMGENPTAQPGERTHRVTPTDTLWGIAQQYLGDGSLWPRIQSRNPTVVSASGEIVVGSVLLIPASPDASAQPQRRQQSAPSTPKTKIYIVRAGDTLSEIAQRELGSANRWREIVELNSDRISAPEQIYTGLRLKLPTGSPQ